MARRTTARRSRHAAPRGARAPGDRVLLAWARDTRGRKVRADRLSPAERRGRAPFTCLGCGEPLVPHLGRVRTRHFAHRPGSSCPLTAPETALHLDAKERLLALCSAAFGGRLRVRLATRCPSCRRPVHRDLAALGDAAVEEGAVGPLRADVLVTSGGRPSLAIEVRVTHALGPEKEAALSAAGVPAVEVDAREDWESEEGGAMAIVCARSAGFAPCAACEALARAERDRGEGGEAAQIAELEAYRARGLFGALPAGSLATLGARFSCPDCGGRELVVGEHLARHACPGGSARPVAWRGYDGEEVELSWWRAGRRRDGAR